MLDQEIEKVETFFTEQISITRQPHVLGFRIGYLRAKNKQGEDVPDNQWKELIVEFPNRKTLIKLENARQEILHGNGNRLSAMETLRKQVQTKMEILPETLWKNEEWVRSTVEKRLFAGIDDLASPFTEDILPLISENYAQNDLSLQGVIEQSLTNI